MLITTKGCIKASPRVDLDCESEFLFIDVATTNNRKITMGVFYRPPDSDLKVLQDLQNSLSNITTHTILIGDFNLSEFDWASRIDH